MRGRGIFIASLVLVFTVACGGGFPPEFPAEPFTLTSPVTGTTVSLSDIRGKPAIIYWFTSW